MSIVSICSENQKVFKPTIYFHIMKKIDVVGKLDIDEEITIKEMAPIIFVGEKFRNLSKSNRW